MPFIHGIDVSEKDQAITQSIIVLAKNMGMEIIAEGVETQQQETFLTQRLCDVMQGFYYHKPMPVKEIEALLKKQQI
jgi:EAL domain-containing protein (putative c-di-GMP-specific phosphodiesterase class I)